MKKINIAVCSLGDHALRNVIPAIVASKKVNLIGLFTRNKIILSEQSEKYTCNKYATFIAMLEDKNVDIVYICSPNALHYEQAKLALLHNKHIIVEKTAFSSVKETQEILTLASSKGCVIMEALMFRFHKQFKTLQRILASKKYGEIFNISASFGYPHLENNSIRYSEKLGGGALIDAGIYPISFTLFILGNDTSLLMSKTIKEHGYEVDTAGFAIFNKDNIMVNCQWIIGASYKNRVDIWCTSGHICVDMAFSKRKDNYSNIQIKQNGQIVEEINIEPDNHFLNMIDYFCDLVDKKNLIREQNNLIDIANIIEKIKAK